jgi:hypothetical protein
MEGAKETIELIKAFIFIPRGIKRTNINENKVIFAKSKLK